VSQCMSSQKWTIQPKTNLKNRFYPGGRGSLIYYPEIGTNWVEKESSYLCHMSGKSDVIHVWKYDRMRKCHHFPDTLFQIKIFAFLMMMILLFQVVVWTGWFLHFQEFLLFSIFSLVPQLCSCTSQPLEAYLQEHSGLKMNQL